MAVNERRIEIATKLFEGWSCGLPDGPKPYLTDDAVLFDIVSGRFEGWSAIRAFHRSSRRVGGS